MQHALQRSLQFVFKHRLINIREFRSKPSPDMFTPHLELSGNEPKGENISTIGVPEENMNKLFQAEFLAVTCVCGGNSAGSYGLN